MTPTLTFACSICGDPSTNLCVFCTKDACGNHVCERCHRCSDCCQCEIHLDEHSTGPRATVRVTAAELASPAEHADPPEHADQLEHAEGSGQVEDLVEPAQPGLFDTVPAEGASAIEPAHDGPGPFETPPHPGPDHQ